MFSTRARYAVRVMLDLAQHRGGYVPMKEVAARQELSLKYIEQIMPALVKASLVEGIHGKGGGYRLIREPEDYSVWEILRVTQGDLAPVSCLEEGAPACPRAAYCRTLPMWKEYHEMTIRYFSGVTLRDLMDTPDSPDFVI